RYNALEWGCKVGQGYLVRACVIAHIMLGKWFVCTRLISLNAFLRSYYFQRVLYLLPAEQLSVVAKRCRYSMCSLLYPMIMKCLCATHMQRAVGIGFSFP